MKIERDESISRRKIEVFVCDREAMGILKKQVEKHLLDDGLRVGAYKLCVKRREGSPDNDRPPFEGGWVFTVTVEEKAP